MHFAIQDLLAEHVLPRALAASIELFAARQVREIADPNGLGAGARVVAQLLPPRRFLPKPLPAALAETFGVDLAATVPASYVA